MSYRQKHCNKNLWGEDQDKARLSVEKTGKDSEDLPSTHSELLSKDKISAN